MKKCYYKILEVDQKATDTQLKQAFRKQALKWHPDKNPSPQATQIFQEINQAYNVLSDPQQRKWYDDHRQQILSGGNITEANYMTADDLFKYFSTSIFKNKYTDDENGFYRTYDKLFKLLDEQQDAAVFARTKSESDSQSDDEPHIKYPKFGRQASSFDDLKMFYEEWSHFYTRKKFSYMDKYNPNEGPNRKIKRLIIQQNQKERTRQRKEFNSTIHRLVDWLQKRDPRWIEYKRFKAEEQKKKEEQYKMKKQAEKAAKKEQRKIAMAEMVNRLDIAQEERLIKQYEEQLAAEKQRKKAKKAARKLPQQWNAEEDDWKSSKKQKETLMKKNKKKWKESQKEAEQIERELEKSDDQEEDDANEEEKVIGQENEQDDDEPQEFLCQVCDKIFKSKEQLKNHFESKKHKKMVKEVMKELKVSNDQMKDSKLIQSAQKDKKDQNQFQDREQSKISQETKSLKKNQKKLKKKQKKWNQFQTKDEDQVEQDNESQEEKAKLSPNQGGQTNLTELNSQQNKTSQNNQEPQSTEQQQQEQSQEQQKQEVQLLKMPGQQDIQQQQSTGKKSNKKNKKSKKQKQTQPATQQQIKEQPQDDQQIPYESLSKKQKKKLKQKAKQSMAQWVCNVCAKQFETRNSLFKHLKQKKHERADPNQPIPISIDQSKTKKKGKSKKF